MMFKKAKKLVSTLAVSAMMLTILPFSAFAADNVTFTNTTKGGLDKPVDNQALGWVKIGDITDADDLYVSVELPKDVDFALATLPNQGDAVSSDFIQGYDTDGNTIAAATVYAFEEDTYTVKFTGIQSTLFGGAGEKSDAYIRVKFDGNNTSKVNIKGSAADEVKVKVTVKGVEQGSAIWDTGAKEFTLGKCGEKKVTATAEEAKAIKVGQGKDIAKIKITEGASAALKAGDTFTLTLPDGVEWEGPTGVISGKYGLAATAAIGADANDLELTVTASSATFGDELSIEGVVTVLPNAADGDVEVSITSALNDTADFTDTDLVVAKVGDSDVTITVEDVSDDKVFPATYGAVVDSIKLESTGNFGSDDYVTLTLSDGARWYDVSSVAGARLYDDNKSVWVNLPGATDEFTIEDFQVATEPTAPAGKIKVTIGGTYKGTAEVGEVLAPVKVTADKPVIKEASLDQVAGDITITELDKKGLKNGGKIVLDLPTGVSFAKKPSLKVNGDDAGDFDYVANSDQNKAEITVNDLSDAKIDTLVISDLKYDVDTRVRSGEVKVEISGTAINKLNGIGDVTIEDFEADYADDAVATVANAASATLTAQNSAFTVGATTYKVGGVDKSMDVAPYVKDGRTYMPVRYVALAIGVADENILWDAANQTVTMIKGDKVVQVKVGSNTITINGAAISMDVAPEITSDRTMLPLRFLAQAFGGVVGFDEATQTATVEMK